MINLIPGLITPDIDIYRILDYPNHGRQFSMIGNLISFQTRADVERGIIPEPGATSRLCCNRSSRLRLQPVSDSDWLINT